MNPHREQNSSQSLFDTRNKNQWQGDERYTLKEFLLRNFRLVHKTIEENQLNFPLYFLCVRKNAIWINQTEEWGLMDKLNMKMRWSQWQKNNNWAREEIKIQLISCSFFLRGSWPYYFHGPSHLKKDTYFIGDLRECQLANDLFSSYCFQVPCQPWTEIFWKLCLRWC